MKKLLILCAALAILLPASFAIYRIKSNINSIVPYPFIINPKINHDLESDAPIFIVGDMMAKRLATFSKMLAEKISGDIEKPIQIHVLATEKEGIHRTLDKIKKLKRLPFVVIYMGNIDNNYEETFYNHNIHHITKNFELYHHPLYQSAIMLFPRIAQILYTPIKYKILSEEIFEDKNLARDNDPLYQKRMEINFKLYEAMLDEMFKYTLKANSVIIPVTTGLNLRVKPTKSCYGSFDENLRSDYDKVIQLIKEKDYKGAYNLSTELVLINSAHASTHYLHALASERINKFVEAKKHYELAIAYDCGNPHRGNPVYNAILKQTADKNGLIYIDFHNYLSDQAKNNYTFIDELYPQDIYLEKLTDMLALRIKKLLKLN